MGNSVVAKASRSGDAVGIEWLSVGGETGELVRGKDWSSTPLGPIASWPQSLRTTVNLCLASRFPIVIYWGSDLVTIYNDAYAPILGQKHPLALGRPCQQVWSEIWDVISPMLTGVMDTGKASWSDDLLLMLERRGYPEECYFSFSFTPVQAEDGRVNGIFTAVIETTERVVGARRLAMLRDLGQQVTEASTAEQACERAARTLARNLADLPFSLIYLLDAERRVAHLAGASGVTPTPALNVVALESSPDGVGAWLSRATTRGKGQRVNLNDRFEGLFEGGSAGAASALVLPLAHADQTAPYGVLIAGISPHRELDEQYRGFYDLVADGVTTAVANARAYEQERSRAEALAEIDRAKTAFFSNVSHEFRTPLTLMLGPVEDILSKPAERVLPENRDLLEVVHRNGLRLQKLVNTLLDFSRIEARRVQAAYEPTDISALTADLASNFQSACERAGLRLTIHCPLLGEPVYVDRDMWEKIVLNLISNAFKFTFAGEIGVEVRQTANAVELVVRDTGIGILPEELPFIFERFHRVKGARGRTHEGTGIGLALVNELVKLHGGTVRAKSVPNEGSTFIVSMPKGTAHLPGDRVGASRTLASTSLGATPFVEEALRWLPDGDASEPSPQGLEARLDFTVNSLPSPFPPARFGDGRRARILWADDNADMRDYVRGLLSAQYDVEAVADGQAALAAARAHEPNLVIADVMMPHMDGFQLLRELRADERTREVPIILLSARAGEESRIEGLGAGADDYLIKPFSARELLARVESHLRLQSVRREAQEELRASEAKFAAAFDQSPLAFTITSPDDGRFVEVNEGFVRLSGYTRGETLGRTPLELRLWVEPERQAEVLAVLRAGGRISSTEIRFRTKGGEELVCLVGSSMISIRSKPHVLTSVIDITGRRKAEEALRESERRFREMIDAIPAAIYTTDAEGRLTHFNRAAVEFSGRVPELGTDQWCVTWKLYYPDGTPMPHDECPMAIALKEGRPIHGVEAIAERPDGRRIWFEPFPTPLMDPEGRVVGGINMLLDITDRKRVSEVQGKLAAIVEFSDDAIISKDLNAVITSWNRGAERLFGYTAQEAIGQPITMLFPPERLDEEPRILAQIRRGEAIEHFETVRRRKDGTLLDISLTVSPIRDEHGHVVGVSKIARDITARKRAEAALRESEEHRRRDLERALQTEREITEAIQRSLLPDRLPQIEGVHLAARYFPASPEAAVGGDFYDVFTLPNGHLGLAIGDVAGYGVQAASVMGQVRMLLRAYAHEGHPPETVISRVNRLLGPGEMVTVLYIVLDPASGQLTYANAGHPPPLVIAPDGAGRFLYEVSPPLIGGSHQYKQFSATVVPASTVILYTDGLVESDKSIEKGLARLSEISTDNLSAGLEDLTSTIVRGLVEEKRRDDVALLAFRLQPIDPKRFRIVLPSVPHSLPTLRFSLRRWLEAGGALEQDTYDIVVACGEAGTNVVEHAYGLDGGSFEVEAERDDDRIVIRIRDKGIWRPRSEGNCGHGLMIIQRLMDAVDVVRGPAGTTVELIRRLRLGAEV